MNFHHPHRQPGAAQSGSNLMGGCGQCWAAFSSNVVRYYFACLPDGFYTPGGAHESVDRVVLRNTCFGWTYKVNAPMPPQLRPSMQEPLWRELLLEVHSIDRLAGLLPWLELTGYLLIIIILVSVVLWNPVLRQLQVQAGPQGAACGGPSRVGCRSSRSESRADSPVRWPFSLVSAVVCASFRHHRPSSSPFPPPPPVPPLRDAGGPFVQHLHPLLPDAPVPSGGPGASANPQPP